ncbi:MAG TPA: hypothetical protein VH083_16320 [Myxococcales bacterium]|nr:hypothetical protein [Myxococcales bacterium]
MRLQAATIALICCAACSSQVIDIGPGAGAQTDGGNTFDGGTISGSWAPVTSNLAGMSSECGDMSFVSVRPDQDVVIAGIALDGLYAVADGGTSFSPLGKGTGSATIVNRTSAIVYDPDHPQTFWESGTYNDKAVYRTDDNGATFTALGNATHSDLVSVDFTDPNRQTLLAGSHETTQALWLSQNGGASWTNIWSSLPAGIGFASAPHVIGPQTFLLGTYFNSNDQATGIYRTTNAGAQWTRVFDKPVRNRPLAASDGKLYWPIDTSTGAGVAGTLAVSNDEGATWSLIGPAGAIDTNIGGPTLLELPDHRFAALSQHNVIISSDHGVSWKTVTPNFPDSTITMSGLAYSQFRKAFLVWHFGCSFSGDAVPADAILATPFDYTAQ